MNKKSKLSKSGIFIFISCVFLMSLFFIYLTRFFYYYSVMK